MEPDEALQNRASRVTDCVIENGGLWFEEGCGVLAQQVTAASIEHNAIRHFGYTGVSVGWTWGYAPTSVRDNRVAFNDISYIGRGTLSDMGCVYTLGIQPGSEVVNNVCHNVESYDYGGWGLYTDEGSSHILLRDNVVYSTKCAGVHQHYGENNTFTNNILALVDRGDGTGGVPALDDDCDAGLRSSQHAGECSAAATGEAQGACSSFAFVGNIVVVQAAAAEGSKKSDATAFPRKEAPREGRSRSRSRGNSRSRYPTTSWNEASSHGGDSPPYPASGLLDDSNLYNGTLANMTLASNVYWSLESESESSSSSSSSGSGGGSSNAKKTATFDPLATLAFPPHAANDFTGWQALGKDAMSVVSDPLFTNVAARNFTLLPGSPALALGFQQIDTSTVGPRV